MDLQLCWQGKVAMGINQLPLMEMDFCIDDHAGWQVSFENFTFNAKSSFRDLKRIFPPRFLFLRLVSFSFPTWRVEQIFWKERLPATFPRKCPRLVKKRYYRYCVPPLRIYLFVDAQMYGVWYQTAIKCYWIPIRNWNAVLMELLYFLLLLYS